MRRVDANYHLHYHGPSEAFLCANVTTLMIPLPSTKRHKSIIILAPRCFPAQFSVAFSLNPTERSRSTRLNTTNPGSHIRQAAVHTDARALTNLVNQQSRKRFQYCLIIRKRVLGECLGEVLHSTTDTRALNAHARSYLTRCPRPHHPRPFPLLLSLLQTLQIHHLCPLRRSFHQPRHLRQASRQVSSLC